MSLCNKITRDSEQSGLTTEEQIVNVIVDAAAEAGITVTFKPQTNAFLRSICSSVIRVYIDLISYRRAEKGNEKPISAPQEDIGGRAGIEPA